MTDRKRARETATNLKLGQEAVRNAIKYARLGCSKWCDGNMHWTSIFHGSVVARKMGILIQKIWHERKSCGSCELRDSAVLCQ